VDQLMVVGSAPLHRARRLRSVGGVLRFAHAEVGDAILWRGDSDRGNRKSDDPEEVIDALLFDAPRHQCSAVNFAHSFLLVTDRFQRQDYALMAASRKGGW